jgi:hypothetical protein
MDHSINRSMGHCGLLIHCSIDRPFPQAFYFQNIRPMDQYTSAPMRSAAPLVYREAKPTGGAYSPCPPPYVRPRASTPEIARRRLAGEIPPSLAPRADPRLRHGAGVLSEHHVRPPAFGALRVNRHT